PLPICPPPCPDTETAPLPTPRTLTSRPQRTRPDPPAHRQPPCRPTTPAATQLLIVDWSKPNPRPPEHRRTDPSYSLTSSSLTARSSPRTHLDGRTRAPEDPFLSRRRPPEAHPRYTLTTGRAPSHNPSSFVTDGLKPP